MRIRYFKKQIEVSFSYAYPVIRNFKSTLTTNAKLLTVTWPKSDVTFEVVDSRFKREEAGFHCKLTVCFISNFVFL